MYDWFLRFLPPRLAGLALTLWYALLLIAVLWCLGEGDVPFRYGEI